MASLGIIAGIWPNSCMHHWEHWGPERVGALCQVAESAELGQAFGVIALAFSSLHL